MIHTPEKHALSQEKKWKMDQKLSSLSECNVSKEEFRFKCGQQNGQNDVSIFEPLDLLTDPGCLMFQLVVETTKVYMLTKFHEDLTKMWPIERSQGCPFIRPLDLVIDPRCPVFKIRLEIIKVYMMTKFHEVLTTNVAYREVTRLSLYLIP